VTPERGAKKPAASRRTRTARAGGGDLIEQLNAVVAELIRENRKLKRQVDRLTERGSAAASTAVERSLRTIQRRVQKALAVPAKGRRRKGAAGARRKVAVKKASKKKV
jgi:uncharacterized coiled-coil protein SlyX